MIYTGRHALCGTMVADQLPDGYPVHEGVGLFCPRCRASFWHMAADEPTASRPPEPAVPPPEPVPPGPGPEPRGPRIWPAVALIGVTAAAVVLVVLVLSRDTESPRGRRPAPTPAAPVRTPAATPTTPQPPAARVITFGAVKVELPRGWQARGAGPRRLVLAGPGAARVTVSAAPLRGRTLHQLGLDTRAALKPAHRVPLRRVSQGGRPALRVTAHGREVTALVLGPQVWVIDRHLGRGGRGVARSVRIG